jgi:hypothetical protein
MHHRRVAVLFLNQETAVSDSVTGLTVASLLRASHLTFSAVGLDRWRLEVGGWMAHAIPSPIHCRELNVGFFEVGIETGNSQRCRCMGSVLGCSYRQTSPPPRRTPNPASTPLFSWSQRVKSWYSCHFFSSLFLCFVIISFPIVSFVLNFL